MLSRWTNEILRSPLASETSSESCRGRGAKSGSALMLAPLLTYCVASKKISEGVNSGPSSSPPTSPRQEECAGGHRASCTGEERKEILLISCDATVPRTWLFCFLCLLPRSWTPGRGGCSQCQRVPQGAEQRGWEPQNELCEAAQIF